MPTDLAKLRELLARVESANGGDRKLDWDIADVFELVPAHSVRDVGFNYDWFRRPSEWCLWKANDSEGRNVSSWGPDRVTSSIDAAVALCERVLPGWHWSASDIGSTVQCREGEMQGFASWRRQTAIALCIAILRAKIYLLEKEPN